MVENKRTKKEEILGKNEFRKEKRRESKKRKKEMRRGERKGGNNERKRKRKRMEGRKDLLSFLCTRLHKNCSSMDSFNSQPLSACSSMLEVYPSNISTISASSFPSLLSSFSPLDIPDILGTGNTQMGTHFSKFCNSYNLGVGWADNYLTDTYCSHERLMSTKS